MRKPNKDVWIRHRGGKCPVEAGARVDYRMRDGEVMTQPSESLEWHHFGECGDIMAYRLHQPADQPCPVEEKAVERIETLDPAKTVSLEQMKNRFSGPFEWRDRITEIDASVEALEEERASLVQRLEAEGFRLIERAVQPVEDMSDWRNWKVGDLLEMTKASDWTRMTDGKLYEIVIPNGRGNFAVIDDTGYIKSFSLDDDNSVTTDFKWHSRPSK